METHGYYHDVNNYLPAPQQQQQQQSLQQPQLQPQSLQQPLQLIDGFLNQTQFYQQNQTQYNLQQPQQQQNSALQQPQYFGGHAVTTKLTDDTALRQQQQQVQKTTDASIGGTSVSFNSSNLNVEINCNQYPNNNTLNNNTLNNSTNNNNNIGGYPISNNSNNSNINNNSTNMLNPPYFYHYPHQKVQNTCDIPQSNTNSTSNSHQNSSNSSSSSTAAPYYDAAYQKSVSHPPQYPSVYPPPTHHTYYHHPANPAGIGHPYTDLYNQSGRHASAHHNPVTGHRGVYYQTQQQQAQYPMKPHSMPITNSTANYGHYPGQQTVRNSSNHTENLYTDPRYSQYYTSRQYPANYYPPQIIPPAVNQSSRTNHTNLPSSQELSRSRSIQRAMYSNNPHQTQQPVPSQYIRNGLYSGTVPTNNSVIKSTASEMMHETNQHHSYDDRYAHAAASSAANAKYYNNCVYNGDRGAYTQPGATQSASCELNNIYQNYHHMLRNERLPNYNTTNNSYLPSHSDMYSLNSAKISSNQSNQSIHRSLAPPTDKFNFIDLEDQINCSKIMKSRDSYFGQYPYHGDPADENAKSQNLRDFLATWNEEEDDEAKLGNSGYSTTHIEIGNRDRDRDNKFQDSNKRDCDEDGNPPANNNNTGNTAPRIHVGITVGNSNNNNNLPDIIIDIEKPKTHSGDDGSLSIVNNSEKLYVLESIDVPVSDLSKYKHLSVVNKLPENIIHISRANGEFGETIETSLKFIEEVEKNREKYYKNDFELNVEYESGKNSPSSDRKLLPVSLAQYDDDFMYEYEVNKFLKDSLDMIEAEEKNKNRILPKFEKFAKDECIVIDDDEDEVKIKIEPKEEKIDYIPAKRRRIGKVVPAVEPKIEVQPEPQPQFQPKLLKTICDDYMKTDEYHDFITPKYNPKTLREICEQYMDETEITIMIPEPLSLREICENFVMSHREYFIVHEAYCEEPYVPTLKALCEQVLDTNYYFEFDTSGDDEIEIETNINDNDIDSIAGIDDNNNIQIDGEIFPASLLAPDAHDDDINEIIINDGGTTRKLIHDKLYLKYSKKLLYYQSNFKNMKKILKKYFVYFVRRRKISIEKFIALYNKPVPSLDTNSSYSADSNSSNTNNDTCADDTEMIFLSADESHIIAKDDKKPNNDNSSRTSSNSNNSSSNDNSHRICSPNIPKPHKKRKLNFDEILLNIDKYYSNSHNLNNNNSTSNNNNNNNNNSSPSNHQQHTTKVKRDTSSSHESSNNKKVSRLIIPRSKILNVDELKTIRENNVKLPYVRLERNIYIDKLARMQS